jgi:Alginate export
LIWIASMASNLAAQQVPADSPGDAITGGRLLLELRPRYADIWDAGLNERGHAWTLRSTVGWQTAMFDDFQAVVEGIHTDLADVHHISIDASQYGASPYPLLPDPRETDTNRVYLDYSGLPDTRLRLGKQPVRLDNERFFSDVDFRQTPMLFNGLTVVNDSLPDTDVYAALLNRIRTVFATQARTRIWLLRVAYSPAQDQSIAAYGYGLNQPQDGNDTWLSDNSHEVFGLRAEGVVRIGAGLDALYTAEAAHQRHYAGGDPLIEANYWRLGAGLVWPRLADFGVRVDREVKTSNQGQYGFQMPFEDTYAFNGWALQFTTTPPTGLRDSWLSLRAQPGRFALVAEAHHFTATYGGSDYGNELDLRGAYAVTNSLTLKLQHARFHGGGSGGWVDFYDVTKTWLTLTYDY